MEIGKLLDDYRDAVRANESGVVDVAAEQAAGAAIEAAWAELIETHRLVGERSLADVENLQQQLAIMQAALRHLSRRHEWAENIGPCVCKEHETARELLRCQSGKAAR